MHVGFLVRSTAALTERWTTTHWVAAAAELGHDVWIFEPNDLSVEAGVLQSRAFHLVGEHTPEGVRDGLFTRTLPRRIVRLHKLHTLFLRCTPPDLAVIGMAAELERRGVRVINAPRGLVALSQKSWLAQQPDVPLPSTLVTNRRGDAHVFHQAHGDVVLKPDQGSGGTRVVKVEADDHEALDDAFTEVRGTARRVVIQACLDGTHGERRLLWCQGKLVGGYLRQAQPSDFRHNVKQGSVPAPLALTDADHAVARALSPALLDLGIGFAALDVLDGRLLEVNAVNPGGTVWADALHGTRLAHHVVRALLGMDPLHP